MLQLNSLIGTLPRKLKTLSSGFALGGLMLLALGCEFVNASEAQDAIQDVKQVRQVQDREITPRLEALESLRQDEILPREQQIQRLSRQIQSIYREQILPLQTGVAGVAPATIVLSDLLEEMDAKTRELRDRSEQLERETQQRFDKLEREGSSERFEQERVLRDKQDAIRRIFRQMEDTNRSAERRLNALYKERQAIEEKLHGTPTDAMSPDRLRALLDTVNAEIRQLEEVVRSEGNDLSDQISLMEQEVQRLQGVVDGLRSEIRVKNQELDQLRTELESSHQADPEIDRLYQRMKEIHAALSVVTNTDVDVDALHEELAAIEREIAEREARFNAEVEALRTSITEVEAAASRLQVELSDMEAALTQRETDLGALRRELEQLHAAGPGLEALYQRRDEIRAEMNSTSADSASADTSSRDTTSDRNTATTDTSSSSDLEAELRAVEQQIADGEAEYKARIAALEEKIASYEAEVHRLRQALAEGNDALQAKHRLIGEVMEKLKHVTSTGPQVDDLHQRRDEIQRKLANVEPVDVAALKDELASIEQQIAKVEAESDDRLLDVKRRIASLEDEVARLHRALEERERDLSDRQEALDDVRGDIDRTHRRGSDRLNELYGEREELERQLSRITSDYTDPALLRGELDRVNAEIARVENGMRSETAKLETLIREMEDEIHRTDRELQDQERQRQRRSADVESSVRDTQVRLEGEREALEERVRREFIGRQVEFEQARLEVSEKIAQIMEEEVRPLEEQIKALELELEDLYDSERALQRELRELKARLGDAEREVESRILDLLEDALSNFSEDGVAPATEATTDTPTTDADGTTAESVTPVQ